MKHSATGAHGARRLSGAPRSTRAASNAEQLDGRFLPYNLTPPAPMMSEQTHCFRCWVLPDACLESLPVPPNSSSVYNDGRRNSMGVGLYGKKRRPFKIHVAGLKPEELSEKLERMGAFVKDPLFSQILRHIERDVFPYDRDGSLGNAKKAWPPFPLATQPGDDELVMVWSYWEKGYGDVIANTLLPFGELLRAGAMPRHVALAGMRHATLFSALRDDGIVVRVGAAEPSHAPALLVVLEAHQNLRTRVL